MNKNNISPNEKLKKPVIHQSENSKSERTVKDIIRTPLESIDECRATGEEYNINQATQQSFIDNGLDKEGRNPACEKVVMLKERIG